MDKKDGVPTQIVQTDNRATELWDSLLGPIYRSLVRSFMLKLGCGYKEACEATLTLFTQVAKSFDFRMIEGLSPVDRRRLLWKYITKFQIGIVADRQKQFYEVPFDPRKHDSPQIPPYVTCDIPPDGTIRDRKVRRALQQLNAVEREIVLLKCVDGMSFRDINRYFIEKRRMAIPVSTIRQHFCRALNAMRIALRDER